MASLSVNPSCDVLNSANSSSSGFLCMCFGGFIFVLLYQKMGEKASLGGIRYPASRDLDKFYFSRIILTFGKDI